MKIKIQKSVLLNAIQAVQNVVASRTTLPILSNVLLKAEGESLTLTTTDLDVSMRCRVPATVETEGSTTLPVRRLSQIARELPETEIELESDDKSMTAVNCGSSFFKIIGLAEDEYPQIAQPEGEYGYRVEQVVFREMLRKVSYAASADESRVVLNGVMLSFRNGKLTMVATDGRRLALIEHEVEFPAEAGVDMILPTKAVNELLHTLQNEGELKIFAKSNQVMFEFGHLFLASKLIEGTYPNFRQVIPAQCEERIALERESLFAALRRVSLVISDKSNAVSLVFGKNRLVISVTTPDVGEARETLPIKYAGREIKVAFNPEFLMEPLKTLDADEISIEITDDLSPGVIKCDLPFLYVIMPVRIS